MGIKENLAIIRIIKKMMHYLLEENEKFKQMLSCGKCLEAEVLFDYFGEKISGIDNNSEEIEILQKRIGSRGRFIVGDAHTLKQFFKEKFDIVIIRHPNISENKKYSYNPFFKVGSDLYIVIAQR